VTTFPSAADADRLAAWPVISEDGDRVGVVETFFGDDTSLQWVEVETGIVGRRHLVPLADAFVADGFLQVGYSKERCLTAPVPDADQPLDEEAERRLYEHFGLPWEDQPRGHGAEPPLPLVVAHEIPVRRPSLLERFARS
jgi:hypothetical protein